MTVNLGLIVFSQGMGGAEDVVRKIVSHIDQSRIRVHLIVNEEIKNAYSGLITPANIFSVGHLFTEPSQNPVRRMILKHLYRKIYINPRNIDELEKSVLNFAVRRKLNVLHAHLPLDMFVLSKAKKKCPKDFLSVYTMHGSLGLDPSTPYKSFFEKQETIEAIRGIDHYTSACQYFFDLLKLNGIDLTDKVTLIENGVSRTDSERYFVKSEHDDDCIRIIYLGGERYLKGPDLILGALSILASERKLRYVRLVVLRNVGDAFKEEATRLGVADFIDYIGYVASPLHLSYINDADIFVLPSRTEGVANTLMEAIALEKPVVATSVGGTPEIVRNGVNGLLCEPSSEDIARALYSLIINKTLRNSFSKANCEIKEHFYWDVVIKKYESLYQSKSIGFEVQDI